MAIRESILPEFDHEMATTRLLLERVPGDKAGWKPHPKSMSLGELSSHLADIPHWVPWTLEADSFDIAPPGGEPYPDPAVCLPRRGLAPVRRKRGPGPGVPLGHGRCSVHRPLVVETRRECCVHHIIHHRGQLTVYLRLQGVPLPSIYGPTADEAGVAR